ncbi:MAG: DMT family transporter [Dehalococcoidia bacterium]
MGELAALASAVGWAGTSTALARLSSDYDAPVLSSLRLLFATPFLVLIFFAGPESAPVDLTSLPVLALVASGLIGYGVGDTAYIRTMHRVSIQRVAPTTTAAWVAISAAGGILFLDEPVAWTLLLGGTAIVAGCWLIVARRTQALSVAPPGAWTAGQTLVAILVVATAWAMATLLLAGARGSMSSAVAALIRIPSGGLTLGLIALVGNRRRPSTGRLPRGRDLALIATVGLLGTGLGSWLYIYAVGEAGAARAVILNATSPLMAIPLAMLFLRERPTRPVLAGTVLCVLGTVVVLQS